MINHQAHGQQFYPKLFSINRHNRVEYDEIFKTIENIITGYGSLINVHNAIFVKLPFHTSVFSCKTISPGINQFKKKKNVTKVAIYVVKHRNFKIRKKHKFRFFIYFYNHL